MSRASAIYSGTIRHRRRLEVQRGFEHPIHLIYLDLDELPQLADGRLLDSRPGPWRFRRRDFHGPAAQPLADAVRDTVQQRTGERPEGPVRLLTQLRCFGMSFNPVSFYYCFHAGSDPDAAPLHSVLAEVTNTPWRERHAYALGPYAPEPVLRSSTEKRLHVSPFMGMSQRYEIALTAPGQTLSVHIDCREEAASVFDATLALTRHELTTATLARLVRHDPVAPLRTLSRIYAQGFALKRSGVSVHPHPEKSPA